MTTNNVTISQALLAGSVNGGLTKRGSGTLTLTGTNTGPWAGVAPTGLAVSLEVQILFPWDPATERFTGERIWFDRGTL